MNAQQPPLEAWVLDALRLIGLDQPSIDVPLHVELVNAVLDLGPGVPEGRYISAMRFKFSWAKREAGRRLATLRTDYEATVAKKKAKLMLADGYSGVKAQAVVDGDDDVYRLLLQFRLAEQEEQAMRKFLDACDAAKETWQTLRADERAADRAHAQGYSGGA